MSKKYLYLYAITYFLFLHSLIIGHGFGSNTLIELVNGSKKTIYVLCLNSLHNKVFVASYDLDNNNLTNQHIKIGKKSKSNCHFRLGFDNQFENDIFCTPSQEFYLPFHRVWIPACQLKPGDALLTKNMTAIAITHIEFVCKSLKIYMLEIEDSHTFFVGKYSVLTHNMLLPLTASIGFVVPFGSVATGSIGSFFGPIGLIGGIAIGGLCSIVIKTLYERRIPRYKTPDFNVSLIHNNCHTTISFHNNNKIKHSGCFETQNIPDISCAYSIENPLPQISTGCFEIEIHPLDQKPKNSCHRNDGIEQLSNTGCFPQPEINDQLSFYSQEKNSEKKKDIYDEKEQYNGPWYNRTEDWIEQHPVGQKIKKSLERSQYTNQGKRAFKVIENIENCDGFKKGDFIVVDAMHKDHLEVFGKDQKWKSVSNFDGTHNIEKTKQGKREPRQPLR